MQVAGAGQPDNNETHLTLPLIGLIPLAGVRKIEHGEKNRSTVSKPRDPFLNEPVLSRSNRHKLFPTEYRKEHQTM